MDARALKEAVVIFGPTASGKSALALALAERQRGVVINMDALQLYPDLPILTAMPDGAARARAPHRLYGVRDAAAPASVAIWRDLALAALAEAAAVDWLPILVGGTGLYLEALLEGLSPMPEVAEDLRAAVAAEYDAVGAIAFAARLAAVDPEAAARLEPFDRQRQIRAMAVHRASGMGLSQWQSLPRSGPPEGWAFQLVLLQPDRVALYERCDRRVTAMLTSGAVEEVAGLLERRDVPPEAPILKAVGVAELQGCLEGRLPLEEAAGLMARATRNYAKRQWTWARGRVLGRTLPEMVSLVVVDGFGEQAAAELED